MSETKVVCICGACGWQGALEALASIKHLQSRVEAGEVMPAGECPCCGHVVHLPTAAIPPQTLAGVGEAMQQAGWVVARAPADHPLKLALGGKSHPVFIRATPTDSRRSSPSWAKITLDQVFVDRITMLNVIVGQAGILSLNESFTAEWEYDGSELLMEGITVDAEAFWLHAHLAGRNAQVESNPVELADLCLRVSATDDGQPIFIGIRDAWTKQSCLDSLEQFEQAALPA
ncbi:hypothetical protein [Noviherbaspirillum galbum]|uniref:Uncharacterized protein n=1 Tax=Noviherbaspirillum galbum TaxID=2709383 RepID=A0A6B3SGR9_9BURK|nr:hypothetical protein [Noviherbaspirillum galbum]NEX60064.1 hypothetical protein [Noviherbaspirillum galbum]